MTIVTKILGEPEKFSYQGKEVTLVAVQTDTEAEHSADNVYHLAYLETGVSEEPEDGKTITVTGIFAGEICFSEQDTLTGEAAFSEDALRNSKEFLLDIGRSTLCGLVEAEYNDDYR